VSRLSCAEAMQEFFSYLDRALAGEALEDLEAHLNECLSCCEKLAFSRRLDAFVKERLPDASLPSDLAARVREAIARAGGGA
jgi:mycothiol system anti-sigma-R factor